MPGRVLPERRSRCRCLAFQLATKARARSRQGGPNFCRSARNAKIKPADLTILAKRNNGVFLANEIYRKIDGRYGVGSRPGSAMPIWGCRRGSPPDLKRKVEKPRPLDSLLDLSCDSETRIRERISAIVDYLSQIQEK
jgi:hypothetical protein